MTSRNQKGIRKFYATFLANLRKWLIKIGSPFRISRRFIRNLLNASSRRSSASAGFLLPTVAMITVVVTLLVVVMVARSSERARSASNARVEEVFRSAATPAIERARAKLQRLFSDPSLPRGIPNDSNFQNVINGSEYTFGDEIRLESYDTTIYGGGDTFDPSSNNSSIDVRGTATDLPFAPELGRETINSVWKFPIDTDGNGKFDTFGIYSILFRAPINAVDPNPSRPPSVLESRALPQSQSGLSGICAAAAASGSNTGTGGWIPVGNLIRKSVFIYGVTVPITEIPTNPVVTTGSGTPTFDAARYEIYRGNQAVNAVELQQDRARTPLNNNAVWFENDLELARSGTFRLNGRVYTGGNFMAGALGTATVTFFQVSDPESCYYTEENAKVIVAGNVVEGDALTSDTSLGGITFHLFKGVGEANDPLVVGGVENIDQTNQTVAEVGSSSAFNDLALNQRINLLTQAAFTRWTDSDSDGQVDTIPTSTPTDPLIVIEAVTNRLANTGQDYGALVASAPSDPNNAGLLRQAYAIEYQNYFRNLLRKVPFLEVAFGGGALVGFTPANALSTVNVAGSNPLDIILLPPETWRMPPDAGGRTPGYDQVTGTGLPKGNAGTDLTLRFSGTDAFLPATEPKQQEADGKENFIGDRLQVGNNLPALWYKGTNVEGNLFDTTQQEMIDDTPGGTIWDAPATPATDRYRQTKVNALADLGNTARNDFWEVSTAANPALPESYFGSPPGSRGNNDAPTNVPVRGGLRIVTGAGIFRRTDAPLAGATPFPTPPPVPAVPTPTPKATSDLRTSFLRRPPLLTDTPNSLIDAISGIDVPESKFPVVWSDAMPMTGGGDFNTPVNIDNDGIPDVLENGHLLMRATAVYHYKNDFYHPDYPTIYQEPLACVSSYYDPSTPATARNRTGLADVSGLVDTDRNGVYDQQADGRAIVPGLGSNEGRSNNGIVFGAPATKISALAIKSNQLDPNDTAFLVSEGAINTISEELTYQANLVYPNGRFVNLPLRRGLLNLANGSNLALSDQSAIHAALCSIEILQGTLTPKTSPATGFNLNHGTIKEVAFIDGREVKSFTRNEQSFLASRRDAAGNLVTNPSNLSIYDLEIEQRLPLEIRATEIDLNLLRQATAVNTTINSAVATEFMLPYSGLIYATRDDALPDLSANPDNTDPDATDLATRELLSPTDFLIDSSRRPSAIRLVNGQELGRGYAANGTQPKYDPLTNIGEKGLIMATNLPLYIKGDFNLHTREEFVIPLNLANWNNFYDRNTATPDKGLDPNFACRPGATPKCTIGDKWRPATILADAVTVVSGASQDGFRNSGDYDLRNNANTHVDTTTTPVTITSIALARRKMGFYNNSFVTSADYQTGNGLTGNDATRYPGNNSNTYLSNGVTPIQRRDDFREYGMEVCRRLPVFTCRQGDWVKRNAGTTNNANTNVAGSPRFIAPEDRRFARRVSFVRYNDIYGDGNQSLVMVKACRGNPAQGQRSNDLGGLIGTTRANLTTFNNQQEDRETTPLFLGVTNPTANTGSTYPMIAGEMNELDPIDQNNPSSSRVPLSYGDVGCPDNLANNVPVVDINPATRNNLEGRLRDNPSVLVGPLPAPKFVNPGINVGNAGNEVYRQFDFDVSVTNAQNATGPITVKLSLVPGPGLAATGGAVGSNPPVLNDAVANPVGTDYLTNIYYRGSGTNVAGLPALGTLVAGNEITFPKQANTPQRIDLTVLVVRDSAKESNEQFQIKQALTVAANAKQGRLLTTVTIEQNTGTDGQIQNANPLCPAAVPAINTPAGNGDDSLGVVVPTPTPPCPKAPTPTAPTPTPTAPTPTPTAPTPTPTPTRPPTPTPTRPPTPTPTAPPTPTPTGGKQNSLDLPRYGMTTPPSFAAMLSAVPIGAAYPSSVPYSQFARSGNPAEVTNAVNANRFNTTNTPSIIPQVPLIGVDTAGSGRTIVLDGADVSLAGGGFLPGGGAPPTGTSSVLVTTTAFQSSYMPMLPGMNDGLPTNSQGSLWFRTTSPSNISTGQSYIGETWRMRYNGGNDTTGSEPFIASNYSMGRDGTLVANPWSPSRLVLPRTECISFANPPIQPTVVNCNQVSIGAAPVYPITMVPTNIIDLNLPITANYGSTAAATDFVACNWNSGAIGFYQADWRRLTGRANFNGASYPANAAPYNTCPKSTQAVIDTSYDGFASLQRTGRIEIDPKGASVYTVGTNVVDEPTLFDTDANGSLAGLAATEPYPANHNFLQITANRPVNVIDIFGYDADGDSTNGLQEKHFLDNTTLLLGAGGQVDQSGVPIDPIFVLRFRPDAATSATLTTISDAGTRTNVTLDGLRVLLRNVSPNNVFWLVPPGNAPGSRLVIQSKVPLNATSPTPPDSILTGNFLSRFAGTTAGTTGNSTLLQIRDNSTDCASNNFPYINSLTFPASSPITADAVRPQDRCVALRGVRFLGFETRLDDANQDGVFAVGTEVKSATQFRVDPDPWFNVENGNPLANVVATAITTTDQPILVPVLQIHAPETSPTNTQRLPQPNPNVAVTGYINGPQARWTEDAVDTVVNAYIVAGNVPSRSRLTFNTSGLPGFTAPLNTTVDPVGTNTPLNGTAITNSADSSGGLQNFIRLIENWNTQSTGPRALNIFGGFIQSFRSRFASGPFSSTAPYTGLNPNNLFELNDMTTLFVDPARPSSPMSNYRRYYQSFTEASQAHYAPPARNWGYDVGLLTQPADLFAQRFSTSVPDPNEFFAETDRDDPWVQTLLCSLEPKLSAATDPERTSGNTSERTYDRFAIPAETLRPGKCSSLPSFN